MKNEEQVKSRMKELMNEFVEKSLADYESDSKNLSLKILKTRIKELRWVLGLKEVGITKI